MGRDGVRRSILLALPPEQTQHQTSRESGSKPLLGLFKTRDSRVERVDVLLDVRVGPLSALHVPQRLGQSARDHLRVEAHRLHGRTHVNLRKHRIGAHDY